MAHTDFQALILTVKHLEKQSIVNASRNDLA